MNGANGQNRLGAGGSPITIDGNSVKLSIGDKVDLSAVTFAHDEGSKQDEGFLTKMYGQEARWRELITQTFNAKTNSLGLHAGSGATLPEEISIMDRNPGNRTGRMMFGGFAGKVVASAMAKVGEGAVYASGEFSGGA